MSKQDIFTTVDELRDLCTNACRDIWARPELSGEENYAAEYYEELLRMDGDNQPDERGRHEQDHT